MRGGTAGWCVPDFLPCPTELRSLSVASSDLHGIEPTRVAQRHEGRVKLTTLSDTGDPPPGIHLAPMGRIIGRAVSGFLGLAQVLG